LYGVLFRTDLMPNPNDLTRLCDTRPNLLWLELDRYDVSQLDGEESRLIRSAQRG
jgi:hypothetical protein